MNQQLSNRTFCLVKTHLFTFFLFALPFFRCQPATLPKLSMSGLSIDSKLPIVAYATAFDHFAMACQLLLLSIILGAHPGYMGWRCGGFEGLKGHNML